MGVANLLTKGKLIDATQKVKQIIIEKRPQRMGINYALDRSKKLGDGLDELYEGISKEYDNFYDKILPSGATKGQELVSKQAVQETLEQLPQNIINKISNYKNLDRYQDESIAPTLNNLKNIKGILRKSVPTKIWSGRAIGNQDTAIIEQAYHGINDIMAQGNPDLTQLNQTYRNFMNMRKVIGRVIWDAEGNPMGNKLVDLYKKGGEPGIRIFFEQFAQQWQPAQQIIKDINKFNQRQTIQKLLGWSGIVGLGAIGVGKVKKKISESISQ